MHFEDLKMDVDYIQMKMSALSKRACDNLEGLETSLDADWVKKDMTLKGYLTEELESMYILATVINDIKDSVERLNKQLKRTGNVRPDQETTLPALNEQ
ncbi:hypothetical protein ACMGE7_11715 [Macrococcus equi]|uniref:hypothetical protein n=1 Tax=Macrococcus equi TaxID=3395462 RepID=UPI0039BE0D15